MPSCVGVGVVIPLPGLVVVVAFVVVVVGGLVGVPGMPTPVFFYQDGSVFE